MEARDSDSQAGPLITLDLRFRILDTRAVCGRLALQRVRLDDLLGSWPW